jgi:hypothetical protein
MKRPEEYSDTYVAYGLHINGHSSAVSYKNKTDDDDDDNDKD